MNTYNVIGVMSGTSLDGIDLAWVHFTKQESWKFEIVKAETIAYPSAMVETLRNAIQFDEKALEALDVSYTKYLAEVILTFIKKHQIQNLDAVCSHGHTILHQPEKGITYQIGNRPALATLINETVVCDFRVQDVALGGQGAPLVPIGDKLLFPEYDYCLNLGGFANVSYDDAEGNRIAYDICPVNIVLNRYANRLGFDYDDKGQLAKSGTYLLALGAALNNLPYYKQRPPKSLGLEWVEAEIFPRLEAAQRDEKDILRTMTAHIAKKIASSFKIRTTILVTGGGAYNDYLLSRIAHHKELNLIKPSSELIEYKEALVFGFLGILKLRGENNCLKSVTGARKNHSSGKILKP